MSKPILELKLQVAYDLAGDDIDSIKLDLKRQVEFAIGRGLLSVAGPGSVDEYRISIHQLPKFTI